MKDIYNDQSYLAHNPDWHEKDAPYKAQQITELILEAGLQVHKIAEIGTGSGEILVQLAQRFPEAYFQGYDISEDALHIAQKKANNRIGFALESVEAIDRSEDFDISLVIDVLEHIPDYMGFLEGLAGLSPYTIFHIPLDLSLRTLMNEAMLIESKNRVGHIHNFTEDFILDMLRDYGFRPIRHRYTPPLIHKPSWKQRIELTAGRILAAISPRLSSKITGGYSILVLTENMEASDEQ